jgi:hypothetical protein
VQKLFFLVSEGGEGERRNLNIMTGEQFTPERRHGSTRMLAPLTMPDMFDDVWLSANVIYQWAGMDRSSMLSSPCRNNQFAIPIQASTTMQTRPHLPPSSSKLGKMLIMSGGLTFLASEVHI